LGDTDSLSGKDAETFFRSLELFFAMANDGAVVGAGERLTCLKSTLHGSRQLIYKNEVAAHENIVKADPGRVYEIVKSRLMQFCQTPTEKAARLRKEWRELFKTRHKTAQQFEAEFIKTHREMDEVGLGRGTCDKFLKYVEKVGSTLGE
jgi:hypothetical protein